MDQISITRPHSERDIRFARLFTIGMFPFGIVFLLFGIPSIAYVGGESLWLIIPGVLLCTVPFLVFSKWNRESKVFLESNEIAEARVIERRRRKMRGGPRFTDSLTGPTGNIGFIIVVFLVVIDLLIRATEWAGLRETQYFYIGHRLILRFLAIQVGKTEKQITLEVGVNQSDYESNPEGSVINIRYAVAMPNIALLEKEFSSRFSSE